MNESAAKTQVLFVITGDHKIHMYLVFINQVSTSTESGYRLG